MTLGGSLVRPHPPLQRFADNVHYVNQRRLTASARERPSLVEEGGAAPCWSAVRDGSTILRVAMSQRFADLRAEQPRLMTALGLAGYAIVGAIAAMMSWPMLFISMAVMLGLAGFIRLALEIRRAILRRRGRSPAAGSVHVNRSA